ncbi:uncharacterized protein CMU_003130 [Cryptosporidium muris RN66]|uniref:Uncharacterized protein n=1 Tax=Cryptosporidium muris (strain RN66) TaxID=441375 RepID=B6AJU2_CRYMR|nr:uncharacterized protein CMU_003130 [Cryptosporidium muris RN66]EEA08483.1 hypothetical protein CMU_003130 [Cryptosporidium muris RN66]|eukprot:XP_002142832.1 hypothetical protein [Cryptosporidium muris RN66]
MCNIQQSGIINYRSITIGRHFKFGKLLKLHLDNNIIFNDRILSKFTRLRNNLQKGANYLKIRGVNSFNVRKSSTILMTLLIFSGTSFYALHEIKKINQDTIIEKCSRILENSEFEKLINNLLERIFISILNNENIQERSLYFLNKVLSDNKNITESLVKILNSEIVQNWLYRTVDEIIDYITTSMEVTEKTALLLFNAINHDIFYDNAQIWCKNIINDHILGDPNIQYNTGNFLTNIIESDDVQKKVVEWIYHILSRADMQEYLSLAFWDIIKYSIKYPKFWFREKKLKSSIDNQLDINYKTNEDNELLSADPILNNSNDKKSNYEREYVELILLLERVMDKIRANEKFKDLDTSDFNKTDINLHLNAKEIESFYSALITAHKKLINSEFSGLLNESNDKGYKLNMRDNNDKSKKIINLNFQDGNIDVENNKLYNTPKKLEISCKDENSEKIDNKKVDHFLEVGGDQLKSNKVGNLVDFRSFEDLVNFEEFSKRSYT